jgi:hypothetical protein
MRFHVLLFVASFIAVTGQTYAQEGSGCAEALVIATYNRSQIDHEDWRLASYVTENEYNTIKHDAGVNAVIYGVPVGASYSDYQNRVSVTTNTYKESLTHDQAINMMWTGLDPNAANAYSKCLDSKIFNQRGLHLAVKAATRNQVSIVIVWTATGDEPRNAAPEWTWKGDSASSLPKFVPSGIHIVVLPRPKDQQMLVANFKGYADSLVIDPYPLTPPHKVEYHNEETSEEYRSPEIKAWGLYWSAPYALCTPDKPAGWTIEKVYDFHLESASERNNCGGFTTCGGSNTDTPTHACRIVSVQGHNENRFDGWGRAVAVFHVTWKHPVKNP